MKGMPTLKVSLSTHHTRILIIDDDAVLLEALADTLRTTLWLVVIETANSGSGGLQCAQRHPYDIILCDVSMPDINGLALLPMLKDIAPDSAIIMMTGNGEESTRRTAARLGALDLIYKPFDRPTLVSTLKQVLQAQDRRSHQRS
jgi:DNA-binding NtrC family response regulator